MSPLPRLALACLATGLLSLPLPARDAPAFLPASFRQPLSLADFITCLEWVEERAGPELPAWVVRSRAFGYPSRRPLYDAQGRPVLDGRGEPATVPTRQSGRLFLPPAWRVEAGARVPLVIYCHGTSLLKDAVASEFGGHEWMLGAAAAAYYGFAVAMPDGPGMGADGTAYHPFCHGRSLAYAAVDAIPALRAALQGDPASLGGGLVWDGGVYLMGYSEGGYAALAAAREMETHKGAYGGEGDFILKGSACMAGPFDISGTIRHHILDEDRGFGHPFFLPYVVCGYHSIYGEIMDPLRVLSEKLLWSSEDGSVLRWVNGNLDGLVADQLIARRLGTDAASLHGTELLSPAWTARNLADPAWPGSPIRAILEENDVHKGWTPTRPILFCQSPDDEDVPEGNTLAALDALGAALRREGRDPSSLLSYRPLPRGTTHLQGALETIPIALDWIWRRTQAP